MGDEGRRAELVEVIREVRRRWRLKLAARGAAIVIGGTLAALFASASGLEALRFSTQAIVGFRILIVFIVAALLARWVVLPLMRRVTDGQVAMYLEECDPTLQAEILSAVEASNSNSPSHSPALVERLIAMAIERCRASEAVHAADRAAFRRHMAAVGAIVAAAFLIVAFGPAYLRHGMSALLVISRGAEAASPYKIDVRPGSATVPRGSDQTVTARLVGFRSPDATLMMRSGGGSVFERVPLTATSEPSAFEGMLFHLEKPVDYYVEAGGVRSPIFSMTLVDLPTVRQLELEYHYPAYTGLSPQKVETSGDVAALRGTEVHVRVVPTMATPSGRIVLNENGSAPLTRQPDGSLVGQFTIEKQGFYHIELEGPHGEHVSASPQYTIDVLDDRAPTVSVTKPGRDTSATPVEELFIEAKADDDYGVKQLQLAYSVNGGAEKTVRLFAGSKPQTEVSGAHTIYLEELGLKPGDVVSYYARATDNDAVQGSKTGSSDIYFVQVRPFKKDFKAAQSQAGGGGGGNQDVGALSRAQKDVVAGTFNTLRDRAKVGAPKYRENVVFLTLAQAKVRQQVDELVEKLNSRGVITTDGLKKIAALLPKASAAMKEAEGDLQKQSAKDALSPEQRALQLLQEAEQEYEVEVSANNGGGGGGADRDQMAEDLADLFELELDKLANQYEMQQRADQQSADRQVDELAEKLKELARRQQAEAERQRRAAAAGQGQGGGSASQQRALADEAEQAARRLEQLTRDEPRRDLSEAARELKEAADAMRRAAAAGSKDAGAQAAAAEQRIQEALNKLARSQAGRGERDIQSAMRKADELSAEQKEVASEVQSLDQAGAGRDARAQQLGARKDAMEAKLGGLEQQLQQLADETHATEREASRKLQEAAGSIRDNKIKEKIRYSKGMIQGQQSDYAKSFEQNIGDNLETLKKKIGDAASAMGKASKDAQAARALERTHDLVRSAESLNERARNEQGSKGSSGSSGARGSQQESANSQQGSTSSHQGSRGSQQGSAGSQGSRDAQARGNGGTQFGPPQGGAEGDARPNGMTGDGARQFARELREWSASADALRRQLAEAGLPTRDLESVVRELQGYQPGGDPRGLQQLQSAVDHLKRFEFDLRKKVGGDSQQLFLSGSDEVPAGFRQAIEEYYRALAKKGQK